MINVLIAIAPLFIIIFASAFFERFKRSKADWAPILNAFALRVGLPALIFSQLSKAALPFADQVRLIAANGIFIAVAFLIAYLVGKTVHLNLKMFKTVFLCLAYGNVAYLGIPVIVQTHGSGALPEISFVVAIYLFIIFTFGTGLLRYFDESKKDGVGKDILKHVVKNPLLISVFLGLLVAAFNIPIPDVLAKSIEMVAVSVTPTVLIVIGLFMGKSKIGKLADWLPVFTFSAAKLMVLPGLLYLVLRYSGLLPGGFSITIIEAAMPLAVAPFALAEEFGLDKGFIARSIVLSTFLAALTLPFWISTI